MERSREAPTEAMMQMSEEGEGKPAGIDALSGVRDANELRVAVNAFLQEHQDSEGALLRLADQLHMLEEEMNASIPKSSEQAPSHIMKSSDELGALYERVTKPRFRKTHPFARFLYEATHEAAKVFKQKHGKHIVQQEQAEAAAQEKAQRAEVRTLIPEVRQEYVDVMQEKNMHHERSPEHQAEIVRFERKIRASGAHASKETRETEEQVKEQELLLGAIIEKSALFGEGSKVFHADKYDDYFTHADLAVSTKGGPMLLIDLSYSQGDAGKKQYYNKEHPVRALEYPPHPELAGKPGIPVILGMAKEDAERLIAGFLEHEAHSRVTGQESDIKPASQKDMEKWIDYVLIQMRRQERYLQNRLEDIEDDAIFNQYELAVSEYDDAIKYFTALKKEHESPELGETRSLTPWDQHILYAEADISEHAQREGKPLNPDPVLSWAAPAR
ncbi:MAG: hypothetical protein Q8P78_00390 [bacterium]|nr:hypothetical protein [bacterium]